MPKAKGSGAAAARKRAAPGPKSRGAAKRSPAVDRWFQESDHPLKPLMLRVRRAILAADRRVTESIKWSTPTFSYHGDIASFIPQARRFEFAVSSRGGDPRQARPP